MRISVRQLRRIINEAVAGEVAGAGPKYKGYPVDGNYVKIDVGTLTYFEESLVHAIAGQHCQQYFYRYDPVDGIAYLSLPEPGDSQGDAEIESFIAAVKTFGDLVGQPSEAWGTWASRTRQPR